MFCSAASRLCQPPAQPRPHCFQPPSQHAAKLAQSRWPRRGGSPQPRSDPGDGVPAPRPAPRHCSRDTKAAAASAACLPLWALCCARALGAGRPVASGQHPGPPYPTLGTGTQGVQPLINTGKCPATPSRLYLAEPCQARITASILQMGRLRLRKPKRFGPGHAPRLCSVIAHRLAGETP